MVHVYIREKSTYYQARITVGGRSRRVSTGERDATKARRVAEQIEARENAKLKASQGLSFTMASALAIQAGKRRSRKPLKPNTVASYVTCGKNVCGVLGDFQMGALTLSDIKTYIKKRKQVTGDDAIIKDLRMLSSVMSWLAADDSDPFERNWLKDYKMADLGLYKSPDRKGALRKRQVESLLSACTREYQRTFIVVSLETGMRMRETLALRWDEIDFDEGPFGKIFLRGHHRTKTGSPRDIPLTKRCADTLLAAFEKSTSEFVFPSDTNRGHLNQLKTFWSNVRTKANLKGVRIHDLRHTFASWAADGKIDPKVTQTIMGHTTDAMTKRYQQPSTKAVEAAMAKMAETHLYTVRDTPPHHSTQAADHSGSKAEEDQGVGGAACQTRTDDPIITN